MAWQDRGACGKGGVCAAVKTKIRIQGSVEPPWGTAINWWIALAEQGQQGINVG